MVTAYFTGVVLTSIVLLMVFYIWYREHTQICNELVDGLEAQLANCETELAMCEDLVGAFISGQITVEQFTDEWLYLNLGGGSLDY